MFSWTESDGSVTHMVCRDSGRSAGPLTDLLSMFSPCGKDAGL